MAYNALNNLIDAYIYANGVQAITGQILNGVLKQMVSQLGSGYHLMGVAGPETTPEQNDYAMAYFAATAGEYTDFGGITLAAGEVAVLLTSGNGSWEKQTIYTVPTTTEDLENTAGFITNAVTDLVNYYTKTEVDDTLAGYPTLEALATALADYYTKTEVDTTLDDYATKDGVDETLEDYYTKDEMDAALGDRYTKQETDTKLEDYYKKNETYDKDEVDSLIATLSRQEYIVAWDGLAAPDVSAIPAGVTVTYSGTPYTGTLAASASTVNKIYMVWNGTAYDMYGTSQDGGYSWVPMGTTSVDLSQYATKAEVSQLQQEVSDLDGMFESETFEPTNWLDQTKWTEGFYWTNGHNDSTSYKYTDAIPVSPGDSITFQCTDSNNRIIFPPRFLVALDAQKNILSGVQNENIYVVPSGVAYIVASIAIGYTGAASYPAIIKSATIEPYTEYFEPYTETVLKEENTNTEYTNELIDRKLDDYNNGSVLMDIVSQNYNFEDGVSGWQNPYYNNVTITNNVLVGTLYSDGATQPDIEQVIQYKAGKRYFVYLKLTPSALNAGGVTLKVRGIVNEDVALSVGNETIVSGYADISSDSDIKTFAMFFGDNVAGQPGEAIITANISYFAVIETEQDIFLEDSILESICESGPQRVPKYSIEAIKGSKFPTSTLKRNWCAVGDSLTAQGLYIPETQNALGIETVTNMGVSGRTLADNGVSGMCRDEVLSQIPNTSYLITVMGGTNDWAQSIEIGTIDSSDTSKYCGALNHIIDYISEHLPTARLVIVAPPFALYPNRPGWSDTTGLRNNNGDTMSDYAAAALKVAESRGIPCAKVGQEVGWNDKNYTIFLQSDGAYLHPNQVGGNRLAAVLARYISTIMPLGDSDL